MSVPRPRADEFLPRNRVALWGRPQPLVRPTTTISADESGRQQARDAVSIRRTIARRVEPCVLRAQVRRDSVALPLVDFSRHTCGRQNQDFLQYLSLPKS